jgi:hypothetical protein
VEVCSICPEYTAALYSCSLLLLAPPPPNATLLLPAIAVDGLGRGFMGDGAGDKSYNGASHNKQVRICALAHLDSGTA